MSFSTYLDCNRPEHPREPAWPSSRPTIRWSRTRRCGCPGIESIGLSARRVDRPVEAQVRYRRAMNRTAGFSKHPKRTARSRPCVPESMKNERSEHALPRRGEPERNLTATVHGHCPDFCGRMPQKWDCPLRPTGGQAHFSGHPGPRNEPVPGLRTVTRKEISRRVFHRHILTLGGSRTSTASCRPAVDSRG